MKSAKFERAGALQVMLYLHSRKNDKVMITELYENVSAANETVDSAVKFLHANGLVDDESMPTFPRKRLVSLTENGLVVAEKLAGFEASLTETESS